MAAGVGAMTRRAVLAERLLAYAMTVASLVIAASCSGDASGRLGGLALGVGRGGGSHGAVVIGDPALADADRPDVERSTERRR